MIHPGLELRVSLIGLVVLETVLGCRAAPPPPGPSPQEVLLQSRTAPPYELCAAMLRLADTGEQERAGILLDFLVHDDPGLRTCAHQALVRLLGQDPVGYRAFAPPAERRRLVAAWRSTLQEQEGAGQ